MAGVNDVVNSIAQIKAMADAIKRQQVLSVANGIKRVKAANTSNYNAPINTGSSGGGGGAAPVSTLASLPQTPAIKDLIAKGILKEGMPTEQIQAILSISGLASQVPIDIEALKKQINADYASTTGDILGAGQTWMQNLYGANFDPNGPNAAAFQNDPLFSSYAGGLAQMDETSDSNQATDLAWFDKQQQLQTDYYNSLMASVANGTLAGDSGGGGGGGGGGGHHGGGGGGGSGGNNNDGDLGFGDTKTTVTGKESLGTIASSNISWTNPENYQAVINSLGVNPETGEIIDPEAHNFATVFMDKYGADPEGALRQGRILQDELIGQVGGYDDLEKLNLAWDASAPDLLTSQINDYLTKTGMLPGDDPATADVLEPWHANPDANIAQYQMDPTYSEKYGPDSRLAVLARAALDPMQMQGASPQSFTNVADMLSRIARIRAQNLGQPTPTSGGNDLPFVPNPEPPGTPGGSETETGTSANLPTLEELQSADFDSLSPAQQNMLIAAGMGPPDVEVNPDAPATDTPAATGPATTTTLPQLSPDQVEQLLALDPNDWSDIERQQLEAAGAVIPDAEPHGFGNRIDPRQVAALANNRLGSFRKSAAPPPPLPGTPNSTQPSTDNPMDILGQLIAPGGGTAPSAGTDVTNNPPGTPTPPMSDTFGSSSSYPPGEQFREQLNQSTPQPNAEANIQALLAPLFNAIRANQSREYNAGQRQVPTGNYAPPASPVSPDITDPTGSAPQYTLPATTTTTVPPVTPPLTTVPPQPASDPVAATSTPTYPPFNLQDHLPWQGIPPELTSQGGVVASDPMSQINATVPGAVTAVLDQSQGTQPVVPSGAVGSITDAIGQLPANLQAALQNAIHSASQIATNLVSSDTGSNGIPADLQAQWTAAGEGDPLITPTTLTDWFQSTMMEPGMFGRPATLRPDLLELMHNQEEQRRLADADAAGLPVSQRETPAGTYWQSHDMSPEEINNLRTQQLYMGPLISALQAGASFIQPVRYIDKLVTTAMESQGINDTATSYGDEAASLTGNELPAGDATDPSQLDVIEGADTGFDDVAGLRRSGNQSMMDIAAFLDADRNRQAALSGKTYGKALGGGKSNGGGGGGRGGYFKKSTQNLASDRLRKIAAAVGRTKVLGGVR